MKLRVLKLRTIFFLEFLMLLQLQIILSCFFSLENSIQLSSLKLLFRFVIYWLLRTYKYGVFFFSLWPTFRRKLVVKLSLKKRKEKKKTRRTYDSTPTGKANTLYDEKYNFEKTRLNGAVAKLRQHFLWFN